MTSKQILGGSAALLFLVVLISWGRFSGSIAAMWKATNIPCLSSGHVGLKQQTQLQLVLTVDGAPELLPGNIGDEPDCMTEIHTHNTTGTVYIESLNPDKRLTLGDFFSVWDAPLEREGYALTVFVNGVENPARERLFLRGGQVVELQYRSAAYTEPEAVDFEALFPPKEASGEAQKTLRPQLQ